MNIEPEELAQLREDAAYGQEARRFGTAVGRVILGLMAAGILYAVIDDPFYVVAGLLPLLLVWGVLGIFFRNK